MTYATEKTKIGRSPCTIVEIDVDYCSHVFGVSPCTATGEPCYQGRKTCKDPTNFAATTRTFKFVDCMVTDPALAPSFPSLRSVSHAPSKINPGNSSDAGGLGVRASVNIQIQDMTDGDVGTDPYVRQRSYDPKTRGTWWGKFKARFPFYVGRLLRVRTGYLVDDLYDAANFTTKLFVIDSITGPSSTGMVNVIAKDILKLADDERAQAPEADIGALQDALDTISTSFTLLPVGIGDEDYAASGTIIVGSELMTFTRVADVFTVTRGTNGTVAQEADVGAVVQECLIYTDQKVQDIIYDLLVNYAHIDAAYIDMAAWNAECDDWLRGYDVMSAILPKPTGVNQLVGELCEQGPVIVWWDERAQMIQLQVIRPRVGDDVIALDDSNNIVVDSVEVQTNPNQRLSEVWVHYGLYNYAVDNLNDPTNYAKRYVLLDQDSESDDEFGDVRIRKVFSRWIPSGADSLATVVAFRILNQFLDMPEEISFSLDAKDTTDIWTGTTATLVARILQDATGDNAPVKVQVMEAMERDTGTVFSFVAIRSQFTGRYGFVTEDTMVDFDAATDAEKQVNGFVCQDDGLMPDGTPGYQII
jgi:hypothetical protein